MALNNPRNSRNSRNDDDDRPKKAVDDSLRGQVVGVPESRQLDVLASLFENRGARVQRIPLVTIRDTPDEELVEGWLHEFISQPCDYLILLTGEGLRRLLGFAGRAGIEAEFRQALAGVYRVCRGPKPGRVLREIGLRPDLLGQQPTTTGIIEALDSRSAVTGGFNLNLENRQVGVQLYGEEPNKLLVDYLRDRGAVVRPVAPYVYASDSDEAQVLEFIRGLGNASITLMTFTSWPQFRRLLAVAEQNSMTDALFAGLAAIKVAAVGPPLAQQLRNAGVRVDAVPETAFFMKPMVSQIVKMLG